VVQEYVLNTYTRFDGYDTREADDYWTATRNYWAAVRARWAEVAAAKGGIAIREEAQTGTVISARLLEIADEIRASTIAEAAGIAEARELIDANTSTILAGG
jgi:hypothetical protein